VVSAELTLQQQAIMAGVVEALTDAQIADRLGISRRTVTNQLVAIRRKLGLRNRTHLAVWAVRQGQDRPQ
jgi:DNA-binding CsgD family transcriptional regulator